MNDPITLAKQATPSWFFKIHDIKGLTIRPARESASGWSVLGQLKEGGWTCLDSFTSEQAASTFVMELGQYWPHLTIEDCGAIKTSPRQKQESQNSAGYRGVVNRILSNLLHYKTMGEGVRS